MDGLTRLPDPPVPLQVVIDRYGLPKETTWERARRGDFEHLKYGQRRFMNAQQIQMLLDGFVVGRDAAEDALEAAKQKTRDQRAKRAPRQRNPKTTGRAA